MEIENQYFWDSLEDLAYGIIESSNNRTVKVKYVCNKKKSVIEKEFSNYENFSVGQKCIVDNIQIYSLNN